MRIPLPFIAVAVVLVLLFSSVYTVSETEQAILVQFGMPVGGLVKDPGLHLKVPFIQDVHRFDKRWLEFDADPREVPTKDKKYIWVDAYARWRIVDPLRFYQAVGDERGAQSRLDDVIHGQTRNAVASFDLIELVRSSDRPFQITEELEGIGAAEAMAKIVSGREKIAQIVLKRAAEMTPPYGIELEDVRFRRINYVEPPLEPWQAPSASPKSRAEGLQVIQLGPEQLLGQVRVAYFVGVRKSVGTRADGTTNG